MITHNVRVYEGVQWHQGYDELLTTVEARMGEEEAIVQDSVITEALAVVHYLESYNQEREYI